MKALAGRVQTLALGSQEGARLPTTPPVQISLEAPQVFPRAAPSAH